MKGRWRETEEVQSDKWLAVRALLTRSEFNSPASGLSDFQGLDKNGFEICPGIEYLSRRRVNRILNTRIYAIF
jgi:hypothetical protein